jgi:hypothetical protein
MDFADIDKQLQEMESDSKVTAAKEAAKQAAKQPPYQCANMDERWLCNVCGGSWFGTLTDRGCPNCGAGVDSIVIDPHAILLEELLSRLKAMNWDALDEETLFEVWRTIVKGGRW